MVEVRLSIEDPVTQMVDVALSWRPSLPRQLMRLPAWTPGSYLIRDHVQWLEDLTLRQGDAVLPARRVAVNGWQADLPELAPLTLRYRIRAIDLTVRTCHVDGSHGFLALPGVVMRLEGERWAPHRLRLELPDGWQAFLPLPWDPGGDGADPVWLAEGFDQLVDTPLEVGPHRAQPFTVGGVPHRWVCWGDSPRGVPDDLIPAVQAVCRRCCRLMDEPGPAADRYLFVLHLLEEGYGGLEHDAGSVLQFGWRQLHRPEGRRQLLQLVAHEYLHQWNVRRLRPRGLIPYDYDTPMLTADLWFAEGITSYLDQFLPFQVGEAGEEELLEDLGKDLSRYLLTPGRSVQSLSLSSQEAWVKLYRRQPGAADHQVSYYLKGAVVALSLDLHLRRGGSALLVVLRDLWRRFGRHGRGYGREELLQAFGAAAPDLGSLLPVWLDGHEDPDLHGYLADVGLKLLPREDPASAGGAHAGLQAARREGQLVASRVERDGPAARAGCQCGDELLALDGWRLRDPDELNERLTPAADQELLVGRRGRVEALRLRCTPARPRRWALEVDAAAGSPCHEARRRWLALLP